MHRSLARTLLAALVAVPVLVVAAPAARAGTCPLLVDAAGDGAVQPAGPVLGTSGQLDIRSADIASGTTKVVAVLRVASLASDTLTHLGAEWAVSWRIDGGTYFVVLERSALGDYTARLVVDGANAPGVEVSVDFTHAVITWQADRAALPGLATAGATFDHIVATTAANLGVTYANADAGFTPQTYVDQSTGCVSAP